MDHVPYTGTYIRWRDLFPVRSPSALQWMITCLSSCVGSAAICSSASQPRLASGKLAILLHAWYMKCTRPGRTEVIHTVYCTLMSPCLPALYSYLQGDSGSCQGGFVSSWHVSRAGSRRLPEDNLPLSIRSPISEPRGGPEMQVSKLLLYLWHTADSK